MWDIPSAVKEVFGAARELMHRVWGGRTREQERLEAELTNALDAKERALDLGDLVAANRYDALARRLRAEIAAKYPSR